MILDTANRKLRVVLGEAKITTDCDISASWTRQTREEVVNGEALARTNGVTPVEVLGPPASGYWFQVQELTVANLDTIPHKVVIEIVDGAGTFVVHTVSVPAGQNLTYNAVNGFTVN